MREQSKYLIDNIDYDLSHIQGKKWVNTLSEVCEHILCEHDPIEIFAKCDDRFAMNGEHIGYVPEELGIGEGDAVFFTLCKKCKLIL